MKGLVRFLTLFLTLAVFGIVTSGVASTPANITGQPSGGVLNGKGSLDTAQFHALQSEVQEVARSEAEKAVAAMTASANNSQKEADRVISYSTLAMTVWAAVAAILLGLGTVVGLYGYGQVKEAEERVNSASRAVERASLAATSAEAAVSRIQTVETQVVEPAKERMRQLDLSISNALNDVQHYFEKIEDFEETSVIGEPPEFPPVEYVQRMEEADVVIVIAMRIGAAQQSKTVSGGAATGGLAPVFVKLGKYWNYVENYGRAIARFQRAIAFEPSWEAYFGLSRSFCGLASRSRISADAKKRQLAQAGEWCEKAEREARNPDSRIWLQRGWIAYEQGNFELAVSHYREAKKLDVQGQRPIIRYNLAAGLARLGQFSESVFRVRERSFSRQKLGGPPDRSRLQPICG